MQLYMQFCAMGFPLLVIVVETIIYLISVANQDSDNV